MQSRRLLLAALFAASLVVLRPDSIDFGWDWPTTRNVSAAEPSGATSPAPLNATFDVEPSEAAKNSPLGRGGVIEPPSWQLAKGGARPEKIGGPEGRAYALLHSQDATLVSSPFTLSPKVSKLSFSYRFDAASDEPGVLRAFVLSGRDFTTETKVFDHTCSCSSDWTKTFVEVSKWAGQTIRLRFVRANDAGGTIGLADVATNLLEAKLGRNRTSALVADPVDTSNGNLTEAANEIPAVPGKGVPLSFTRYYNSDSTYSGQLGPKWTNTYSVNVVAEPDGSKTVRYANGKTANFVPGSPPASPSFDAASSTSSSAYSNQISWSHTVGGNSNRLLLVEISLSSNPCGQSTSSVTFAGQSLTQISSRVQSMASDVWYLANPPSGPGTIIATFACTNFYTKVGMAISMFDASQSAPVAANTGGQLPDTFLGTPQNVQVSVASSSSNLIADFITAAMSFNPFTPAGGQTNRTAAIGSFASGAASTKAGGSGSTTMTWATCCTTPTPYHHFVVAVNVPTPGTGDVVYAAPDGNFDKLIRWTDGTYSLTTTTQVRYDFDSNGRLVSIADRNDNTTAVAYDGSGLLASVTDAGGRSLTFAGSGGLLSSVTDPIGRAVSFTYTSGKLTSVSNLLGGSTAYTYNGSNLLLTETNPLGNLVFDNTYDSANRVVKQKRIHNGGDTYTCLYYGTAPSYTDSNCPGVTPAPQTGQTVVVNPRGYKTTYSFDTDFRTYEIKNHLNGVTSYTYDPDDNVLCFTDPLNQKTSLSYDNNGNVIQVLDANNTNSSCGLKNGGGATTITYTPLNDPSLVTDKLGRKTEFSYDGEGNLTLVLNKDASNNVKKRTCMGVNAAGLVTTVTQSTTLTDCTGNTAAYAYDSYGNVTEAIDPRFYGQPTPPKTTMTYDLAGRMLTQTNELSHTNTFTYNARNRVLTARDNLNNTTTYTYDAVGQSEDRHRRAQQGDDLQLRQPQPAHECRQCGERHHQLRLRRQRQPHERGQPEKQNDNVHVRPGGQAYVHH